MKLIIDISDKTYEIIKNMVYFYNSQRSGREATKEILTAIKQGIPLPKCHGRLIDENDLWFEDIDNISCVTQRDVENAPTIVEADE